MEQNTAKQRVCAYCRVSTDNDEQLSSFELQQAHYRHLAEEHPNWDLKHIFADEGISGTSTKKREDFNEMIEAFEYTGHYNPNCYSINSLTKSNPQSGTKRNLIIGDDMDRYITIGENYSNYLNVNILDNEDTTQTHRYAYALEWKEDYERNVYVRYIVTYAKIPQ